ncbi:MAG: ATP-binding protein [Lachnospiraceae bacterium]|nr:ATP-binding protein [Lachnospiraceae bacterium]
MERTNRSDRGNRSLIKEMYRLSFLTMMVSIMLGTLGGVIDGVIVGRCMGSEAMASYGLVSSISPLLMMLGSIVISGASLMCARCMSIADTESANGIFSLSIVIGTVVAIIYTGAIVLFSAPIIRFLGAKDSEALLYHEAHAYLIGLSFGFIFAMGSMILHPYISLEGDRKRTVIEVLIIIAVNITCDLVNVYLLKGRMFGIGLATSLSQLVGFMVSLSHFMKGRSIFKFRPSGIAWRKTADLLSGGLPMAVNRICYVAKVVWLNRIVLSIAGTVALSAISIQNNLNNFLSLISLSTAMSLMSCTGILEGEKNKSSLRILFKTGVKSGVLINLMMTVVVFVFAGQLADIYAKGNVEVGAYAISALRFFACGLVFLVIVQSYICFLLGLGKKRLVVFFMILHNLLFPILCALFAGKAFGIDGVWLSFAMGEMLMLAAIFVTVLIRDRRIPKDLDDYLLLKGEYDISDDMLREWTFSEQSDVVNTSEEARIFLKGKGIDDRRSMLTALCIEEMTGNILSYGKRDGRKLCVYERLVVTEDDLILRIRDNGVHFDPVEWIELYKSDDRTSNIGIRMICGMAKDFRYVNTMGMNNLIITI